MLHVAACYIDLALVVDCSGSIRDTNTGGVDNWLLVIDFMVDLVTSINVGPDETHVAAVSFGTLIKRYSHFLALGRFLPRDLRYVVPCLSVSVCDTPVLHRTG